MSLVSGMVTVVHFTVGMRVMQVSKKKSLLPMIDYLHIGIWVSVKRLRKIEIENENEKDFVFKEIINY